MRIHELLIEGYSEQIMADLQTLLAAAKGNGVTEVSTKQIVQQLIGMGHNVNQNSIMTILTGNPFVQSATPEQIQLKVDDEAGVSGDADAAEDNEARVAQMADQGQDII